MSSPHPTATPHAIEQTERKIQEYASLLAKQGTKIVPDIVARLRKLRPRVDGEEITNFLVTIYCPVINQNAALSDNQKRKRIEAFSSDVLKRLAQR